jgi:hypothetical protein
MMVAPAVSAVMRPVVVTVATDGLLLDQVTGRPLSKAPAASRASGVKLNVPPTLRVAFAGTSLTLATGIRDTVMDERPLFPSTLAAMSTLPSFRPVT